MQASRKSQQLPNQVRAHVVYRRHATARMKYLRTCTSTLCSILCSRPRDLEISEVARGPHLAVNFAPTHADSPSVTGPNQVFSASGEGGEVAAGAANGKPVSHVPLNQS